MLHGHIEHELDQGNRTLAFIKLKIKKPDTDQISKQVGWLYFHWNSYDIFSLCHLDESM